MMIWLDAHLSPAIARWMTETLSVQVVAVRDLGLRDAIDLEIFMAARREAAIMMTKDSDFAYLLDRYGPPPQIIWLTFGNTSNANLKRILATTLPQALALLEAGEKLVEITGS